MLERQEKIARQVARENDQYLDELDNLPLEKLFDEVLIEYKLTSMKKHDPKFSEEIVEHQAQKAQWAERAFRERLRQNAREGN